MTPPKHIAALRAMLRQHGAPGQSDLGSRIGHERRVFGPAFPYLLPVQHGNYLGDELPNSVAERLGSVLDVQGQNMAYSDLPLLDLYATVAGGDFRGPAKRAKICESICWRRGSPPS